MTRRDQIRRSHRKVLTFLDLEAVRLLFVAVMYRPTKVHSRKNPATIPMLAEVHTLELEIPQRLEITAKPRPLTSKTASLGFIMVDGNSLVRIVITPGLVWAYVISYHSKFQSQVYRSPPPCVASLSGYGIFSSLCPCFKHVKNGLMKWYYIA